MGRKSEPATERQMGYLESLVRRLSNLLDEGDDIVEDLQSASASSLSKSDASRLIDTLIRTLDRLGSPQSNVTPLRAENTQSSYFVEQEDEYARMQRARKEQIKLEMKAYDAAQLTQFNDEGHDPERESPEGMGRHIKVWKRKINHAYQSYPGSRVEIAYGWVWTCTHPSHIGKGGPGSKSGVVYGGSIKTGFQGSIEGAERHWRKFHA